MDISSKASYCGATKCRTHVVCDLHCHPIKSAAQACRNHREARSSGRFRGALCAETHSWYVAHLMARPGAFNHTRLQHGLDPPHSQPGGTGLAHLPLAGSAGLLLVRSRLSPPPQGRPPFLLHFSIPFFPLTLLCFHPLSLPYRSLLLNYILLE